MYIIYIFHNFHKVFNSQISAICRIKGHNIFHPCDLCSEEDCEELGRCKWIGGRCQEAAEPPSTSSRSTQPKGKKYLIIKR